MSPAPPPPPPAPAPVLKAEVSIPVNLPNKSALLKSIEKGAKLKKTTTNDRSAPAVSSQTNSAASNSNDSRPGATASVSAPAGLGGLFANGFPKLKSVNGAGSSVNNSVNNAVASAAVSATKSAVKELLPKPAVPAQSKPKPVAMKSASQKPKPVAMKSASQEPKPVAKPPPLPKKTPKPQASSGLESPMSRVSVNEERWTFPADVEKKLPSPRKFTGCKKVYLSASQENGTQSSNSKSGEEISMDDLNGFVDSLNSKLKAAVANENFEECVRIKGKLKRLDALKKRIKEGDSVYSSELS